MGTTLNETPSANRLHIGFFGRTNSGKSSLINTFTDQEVSIVADVAGTTTDPVYKAMELSPIGPCMIIDTAGFGDESQLGKQRMEKTMLAAEKTEIAVLLFDGEEMEEELSWYRFFQKKKIPVVLVVSRWDEGNREKIQCLVEKETGRKPIGVSAKTGIGLAQLREELVRCVPEGYGARLILGNLVEEGDLVLLVMPQDIQAPKGRLILPQVQTIRELLDRRCVVVSTTTDKLTTALAMLAAPPKLIVTDSQVFPYVYENKPAESCLTSFSVLFAAYKGDLPYYVEGARRIDSLTENSRVLIAECCTHAPLKEDIGRVKIPRMLKKRFGETIQIDHVRGTDFPVNLQDYDLIIQCGGCMFNRQYVMMRTERAKTQKVPMTNYGVVIAHLTGILDKISLPED